MLGVSLFISCKNKIQCVCVKKQNKTKQNKKNNIFDPQLGDRGEQERGSPCLSGSHILKGKTDMLTGAQIQWKRQVSCC